MSRNIEERLVNEISPLTEFLGAGRVEDLKDKVCTLILNQVEQDLNERDEYVLIYADDIREIAEEALAEVRGKIKKKFKDRYLELVEDALKGGAE
jgi:hypothetical protein